MSLPKRLKALQGLWVEDNRRAGKDKSWFVDGYKATQQFEDGSLGKSYTITSEAGEVYWGKGSYILDNTFKFGDAVANWWVGNKVGFSWKRVEQAGGKAGKKGSGGKGEGKGEKGESKGEKGEKKEKGGKGKGKKEADEDADEDRKDADEDGEEASSSKPKLKAERRIADDGKAYTLEEMMKHYSETSKTPKIETMQYWLTCQVASEVKAAAKPKAAPKKAPEPTEEQRIDPADGKAYTMAAMRAFYSAIYTKYAIDSYWADCQVKATEGERRIDPSDGKGYTWEELRGHYSSEYTKKETAAYWETLKIATDSKGKGKGKGKK